MKVYRGSPAAARTYVETDRSRSDDYYLTEGTGLAERYVVSPSTGVGHAGVLTGDAYEAWVAGCDPVTGAARGRLRTDGAAVRFVEVVVNGPKSWSLAAALHPDIGAAYDAAQDRAAGQVIGWLAEHATTRVGPRGRQVQVPVAEVEAVTVRHYTSRAGDPHRHLHLQVNARVFAEGKWRGLHTVGVRDSLDALNGIGHAAVMTDPGFRAALAEHGFTVDATSGEVVQLARFVGPFSARAAQIARNVDRHEAQWRAAHPGAEPDHRLRRSWDSRAWAEQRPDKVVPTDGAALAQRWVEELHRLGYRDPSPSQTATAGGARPVRVGDFDRDRAAGVVVARLGARRSGWNAADVRGEVERLIASTGIITSAGVRLELAEDLTDRALAACVPLLGRRGVPEHIRALTSQEVLGVEADLSTRFIARAAAPGRTRPASVTAPALTASPAAEGLDAGQAQVVAALVSDRRLLVVEGAAGAGKTTALAAARAGLGQQGRRLVVVTPTLQAALVAAEQVGGPAFSAAWLAYQHGFRWNADGAWTRLGVGDDDPETGTAYRGPQTHAVLSAGDLLLVDEAGMLGQDTARVLMVIADEHHARVALVGDRHQLPAVGRGGVLDLAARWADPEDCLTLDTVHRFADPEYAQLSLAMRTGQPPDKPAGGRRGQPIGEPRGQRNGEVAGAVFDALVTRGEVRVYATEAERTAALAQVAATAHTGGTGGTGGTSCGSSGGRGGVLVVADTREQVAQLNAAIRDRLVTGGQVDDTHAVTTWAGERVGVGDRIATRRNDHQADVANRDTWTVTGHDPDGALMVTGKRGDRVLPAGYVFRDVELGYASTVYGAQGATTGAGHLVVGEHTGAAAAYVAMTRGRDANTAHLVADTLEEARGQWVEVFSRDRADLGPAHAARLAADEAAGYDTHRRLEPALADLRTAWTREQDLVDRLTTAQARHDQLAEIVPLQAAHETALAEHFTAWRRASRRADHVRERVEHLEGALTSDTRQITARLHQEWDTQRAGAHQAAQTVLAGSGVFGQRRGAVRQAGEQLDAWADRWRPVVTWLPSETRKIADHASTYLWPHLDENFTAHALRVAEAAHPELPLARTAATTATETADRAYATYRKTDGHYLNRLDSYGNLGHTRDAAALLADTDRDVATLTEQLPDAQSQVHHALVEPAIRTLPPDRIETERHHWAADRAEKKDQDQLVLRQAFALADDRRARHTPQQHPEPYYSPKPPSHGIGR